MASPNTTTTTTIKIHDHCRVPPQYPPQQTLSHPLTFFDLMWLRFHPVERIFYYSHSTPHEVVPNLKSSLSLTLQHFLPLAGNIVWPSGCKKPEIQYNPGDGVSLTVAESTRDFKDIVDNSPRPASESRCLVPELESSDSRASVIAVQITIFPESGFSIGISAHHAVLDGKSSTMFVKAWAYLSKKIIDDEERNQLEEPHHLPPELVPLFDEEAIKDPNGRDHVFVNMWTEISSKLEPPPEETNGDGGRRVKILFNTPPPLDAVRATFVLTRGDLEKIKEKVLSMWDTGDGYDDVAQSPPKPRILSTFVLTCAYVSVCVARANEEAERRINGVRSKFAFGFTVDCRSRLDPPVPGNYFGNCVCGQIVDSTKPEDFVDENGLAVVAKKFHGKIKKLEGEGSLDGVDTFFHRAMRLMSEGITTIGVAGSTRFGVYGVDFGWGRPAKVEIVSVDRNVTMGMAEGKDESGGGVEVGLVLKEHVMGHFRILLPAGLS